MAAKKFITTNLAELFKRVPPNQIKQFEAFRTKTFLYRRRLDENPDKLLRIDWEFYRNNVRENYKKMVEEFQLKYEELNHIFASRHEALHFSKYYAELNDAMVEAQEDVRNYIVESNARIKIYQDEIKRIQNVTAYENMTLEQFVIEREDIAQYIPGQGRPLFWPHNASEQCKEYADLYRDPKPNGKPTLVADQHKEEPIKTSVSTHYQMSQPILDDTHLKSK